MIIIRLKGGLGNQMFQIALGKKLEYLGKKVQYDIDLIESNTTEHHMARVYEIFNIDIDIANSNRIKELSDIQTDLYNKIRRKIFGLKKSYYTEKVYGDEDKSIYKLENAYLDGYWQSSDYFNDCAGIISSLFRFRILTDEKNQFYENKIRSLENTVSIHFRLGDYCTKENYKYFGNICTEQYYLNCIDFFRNKFKGAIFFVFSNDLKYVEQFKNKSNFFVVNCNDEIYAWKDMYLMSLCKHNIIANSSFSWWSAWLNKNNEKIVIAPKKWINGREMKNICPGDWLRF